MWRYLTIYHKEVIFLITENLSTLKIHQLTQAQYDRELEAGRLNENELYLTPEEEKSIDDTLSVSGAAADAKAVGDALAEKQPLGDYALKKEIPEQVQADWNQNDNSASDYVKNRPFYTEDPVRTVLVEEQTVSIGSELYTTCPFEIEIEAGKTYFVNFNGKEYECPSWTAKPHNSTTLTYLCLGNSNFLYPSYSEALDAPNSEEPFCFEKLSLGLCLTTDAPGDYVISISTDVYKVNQIDIKYVPHDDTKMNTQNPTGKGYFSLNGRTDREPRYGSLTHGSDSIAEGYYSYAGGRWTTAIGVAQHAEGMCNIEDKEEKYAHIVGNGTYEYGRVTRSNAHTLDWSGNAWFAGDVYVGYSSGSDRNGTNRDEGSKKLATEEYVNAPRKEFILNSSTEDSSKQFKITINDDGVLTVTEIVTTEA